MIVLLASAHFVVKHEELDHVVVQVLWQIHRWGAPNEGPLCVGADKIKYKYIKVFVVFWGLYFSHLLFQLEVDPVVVILIHDFFHEKAGGGAFVASQLPHLVAQGFRRLGVVLVVLQDLPKCWF